MQIISLIQLAYCLLVTCVGTLISSSTGSNMASWFKDIPGFDMNIPGVWGQDALAWDYKKLWADKEVLKTYMEKLWADLSAGAVKGKTNPITWFVADSDDFLNMVGNEYFFKLTEEEQKEVIHNLDKRFRVARDNYYNDEGKIPVVPQNDKNHNSKAVAINFPFGPWVYWTRSAWDELEYKFDSAKRKERLQDAMTRVRSSTSDSSSSSSKASKEKQPPVISYSQKKRGRKNKRRNKDEGRDRSRSRNKRRTDVVFSDDEKSGVNTDDSAV